MIAYKVDRKSKLRVVACENTCIMLQVILNLGYLHVFMLLGRLPTGCLQAIGCRIMHSSISLFSITSTQLILTLMLALLY